ncbi:putative transcriptional regulator, Crp/Fnr family [Hymenobacter roseosalivarius DSM 11622]|uniref:Putative transcriptional regulator, Crp/Fnr family n=1 Tax=Hymenobacter roseosalivarius DSM 11622 TaxID=645990 RepID=A0A1W1VY36_9BACT|nr:cyclic nucleotide-binding domain-containing protein [Hymenobacter roseosalivarius]SMB98302.1 putative transcriptional regulator, Crp/Fnr family [Hymenobacter roseosalivarius DSM 11622]
MLPAPWYSLIGVRATEVKTVWLFFLHNFLLGIGTILVYVSANVILLENNPERNLPLAYGLAALAMMGAGKAYTYFEHRLPLQRLAVRVLLAVVAFTGVISVLVAVGSSVAAAVAIMAGYRVIYLLTNLEFWGVSAVVFDVRQSKRLFGLIGSGDMPAKALGAILALLVHAHTDLLFLLLLAFGAYVGALYTLRATLSSHAVEARPTPRPQRLTGLAPGLQRWFGESQLVLSTCLSITAISAVTAGVEYSFFVNVKHKFHDQATVMRYVSSVLIITYLLAMIFKMLLSQKALERVGIRRMLVALPAALLVGLLVFGALWQGGANDSVLLLYFCGLYLGLEVLRRAVFDPVFLVLFQPLSPPERLRAHTRAKGFYEPLGMALGGILLFMLHDQPALSAWAPFVWMGLFAAGALFFVHRTYGHYMAELQHALGRRFGNSAATETLPDELLSEDQLSVGLAEIPELIEALQDKTQRRAATRRLRQLGPAALPELLETLSVPDTSDVLVRRVAQLCARLPASREALVALTRQPNLHRRETALRALRNFAPQSVETPLFQALVQEEMRLAQQLLHGLAAVTHDELRRCLQYELTKVQQRIFGLLLLLYSPQLIADAQRGIAHAARERQANALEILDNIIPRALYQGLQALLDVGPIAEKVRVFDQVLGPGSHSARVVPFIIEKGEAAFSDWTISVALRHWHAEPRTLTSVLPYIHSTSLLVQESAFFVLRKLSERQHELYKQLTDAEPALPALLMSHTHAITATISARDRVHILQQTALFAETPENVLSSIVPIMREVSFLDGQQIFAKGDLGTSLFIVYGGEVGIFNGSQHLTTFRKGDFFGELALLDAEPRSASAVAQGAVVAFRLDQEDFYDVMEERSEVLRNILRVLCQRLRRQNEKMQTQPPLSNPA